MTDATFLDLDPHDPRLADLVLPVLVQLRPHLTAASLAAVYAEAHPGGLRLTALVGADGECLAVAGWRETVNTAMGRHVYVEDLVTASERRSRGAGATLLAEIERRARAVGCRFVDLDSGTHRTDAHRFYHREGYTVSSFHFRKDLGPTTV
ncbi:GCN5-related protein N-acetyltransferase [Beutenbergia cavernae DSM 12333]|uniref:GCN5-related protein N-acetyltransferase n=1 Tax=Beutenbergia cavernae (strain ATCC BAA-8 / DSM 12333 / CCUG 43141 / JCM 11478 / NBRC 16432 / NCIMB 13614 / HKI 0122) TaxID=471853 RepID=C5C594_BEUC1|nr:GNAT family N-acetyltransferase [Beutenbergia cavernae]ACQ82234.1 GCN5-related protein N-acetyltransferase [Beutenbergia cavernae DSM 12333]